MGLLILLINFMLDTQCLMTDVHRDRISNVIVSNKPRMVGGFDAHDSQFPYMVFLMHRYVRNGEVGRKICSGSLIAPDWVLTAAHCYKSKFTREKLFLVAGKSDLTEYVRNRIKLPIYNKIDESKFHLQERVAEKVYTPKYYNPISHQQDLALIKTLSPFLLSAIVKPLPLSRTLMTPMSCTIIGWGLREQFKVNYNLAFAENVSASLRCIYRPKHNESEKFICLEINGNRHQGVCQGDSGSPLVCEQKIWGVASHGRKTSKSNPCEEDQEQYYSQLYSSMEWIDCVLSGNSATTTKFSIVLLILPISATCVYLKVNYLTQRNYSN